MVIIAPLIAYPLGKLLTTYSDRLNTLYKKSKNDSDAKAMALSILSHDIRSPLINIKQMVGLIADGNLPPDQSKKFLTNLEIDLDRTLILTNNLIKWIRSQENSVESNFSTFSIHNIVKETVMLYKSISDHKNITVLIETTSPTTLYSDEEMCKIVLRNLLSNAIKFSSSGDEINLGYVKEEEFIIFWVKDNGVGMDSHKIESLFNDKLEKSDQGTAQEKGTGIGLKLSKNIIDKLGGSIRVESELNKGTRISFSIPKNL